MLLANYASDSDSDADITPGPSRTTPVPAAAPTASKAKKRTGPVKIGLELPKLHSDDAGDQEDSNQEDDERRSKKRPKNGDGGAGKGSSALLGMLPPPKRKTPALAPSKASSLAVNKSIAAAPKPKAIPKEDDEDEDEIPRGLLLPSSIARNKAAATRSKAEDTASAVDLFGLSSTPESSSSKPAALPPITAKPPTISSAPLIPDFIPPQPTPEDPYPGYYQLPNSTWQAYDPTYYHSFFPEHDSSAGKEKKEDGRVGHHWDDYERMGGGDGDGIVEISASEGLEEARRERERKERMGKPKLPGDDFEYKAVGQIKGLAAERHQLSSLLNSAYTQREELEQRIAQNKKNMRMAGQKYGF